MIKKSEEAVFGPYCCTFDIAVFTTTKKQAGGPTSGVAKANGCKKAFADEPGSSDILKNDSLIKKISGMDKIPSRFNNENETEVEATYKLNFLYNKPPSFKATDNSIKNRYKGNIPFLSKFSDDAPADVSEQIRLKIFPKDKNFQENIPRLAPAILWVWVQYFGTYISEGLDPPPIVVNRLKEYWEKNDQYFQFIKESIDLVFMPGTISDINPNGIKDRNSKMSLG